MMCPHCRTRELVNPESGDFYVCDDCLGFCAVTSSIDDPAVLVATPIPDGEAPPIAHQGRVALVMGRYR